MVDKRMVDPKDSLSCLLTAPLRTARLGIEACQLRILLEATDLGLWDVFLFLFLAAARSGQRSGEREWRPPIPFVDDHPSLRCVVFSPSTQDLQQ